MTACLFLVLWANGQTIAQVTPDDVLLWEASRSEFLQQVKNEFETNPKLQEDYEDLQLQQTLVMEAVRRGLGERLTVRKEIEASRRAILISALAQDLQSNAAEPTDQEIRQFYADVSERLLRPEAYQLDVIELHPEDEESEIQAKSLDGTHAVDDHVFFSIAGNILVTSDPSSWVTEPFVAAGIWNALPEMEDGQIRYFELPTGRFLIRRGRHQEAGRMTFDESRDLLRAQILHSRQQAIWASFLDNISPSP